MNEIRKYINIIEDSQTSTNFSNRNLNSDTKKYVDNHKWKKVLVNINDLDDEAHDDQFGRIIDVDPEVGVNFKDPIMVHADGKTIIDGFHRVYQAKKGGLKQLPAYIPEGTSIQYTEPNLDVEWKEAERYPELAELGVEGWKALKGQQVNVKQLGGLKKIGNTEGTDVNTAKKAIATLEPEKVQRMQQAIKSGAVELPIIAKFHSGEFDLVAGNTRFTGLVANGILPEVYYIDLTTQLNEQEQTSTPKYLYHVTFKSNIQNIKAKGLEQFHTSLWIKGPEGKRYNNEAGIFAFDHHLDAIQWAQKMEWEFRDDIIPNTDNDIAIIRLDMQDGEEIWGDDPSDDIMLARHGKSLRSRQNISADKIIDTFNMEEFGKAGVLNISREEWLSQVGQKLTS